MKALIFPVAVGVLVLAGAVALAFIEACLLGHADAKFDCRSGLQVTVVFAGVAAVLAAIMAGFARALLRSRLLGLSFGAELASAAVASVLLVGLFDGLLRWEFAVGGMAGLFFSWLICSFLMSALALIAVTYLAKRM